MDQTAIEELLKTSDRVVAAVDTSFHRYLMDEIDWRDRLICIKGARGSGKTTILRQHMKEAFGPGSDKAVYISADDLWFAEHPLKDAVEFFDAHGFTHVFIDEIHHLGRNWSIVLKNLYDQFPEVSIVYSGSSMLHLEAAKGDLSRRQAVYDLKGMSFREYLALEGLLTHRKLGWEELLADHRKIAAEITGKIKILQHFSAYLDHGFYPFYREAHAQYRDRLLDVVNKVLESDYPAIESVSQETIRTAKKMLKVLAASTPQSPNMSELYRELGTERNQGLKMLKSLDRAGLLALVPGKGVKLDSLSRPEKIYCDNTNLMNALVPRIDIGVMRETYFYNQVRKNHDVEFVGIGDFQVDGKYTFEVGGKGKRFTQIAGVKDSFVVNDDVENTFGNKIPLWMFGFLY